MKLDERSLERGLDRGLERNLVRRIDWLSLQLFIAVCETGSIARAAEREHLAASAASKRLADLEHNLGATLLYRHAKGVDPTPAGASLLHHARAMLLSLEKMQAELSEYGQGVRGHVRVFANLSAIVQYLPEDLGSFMRQHPQIKIDLEEHVSQSIVRAVQEGATDVGICSASVELKGLQAQPYRADELALVVPRGHVLAQKAQLSFVETLAFDYVGLDADSAVNQALRHAANQAQQPLKLRIQVTSLDAVCRMVHNGLGISVLPRRAFEFLQGLGDLVAIPLTDDWAQRRIVLVARDFSALPMTARLLVEHLGKAA